VSNLYVNFKLCTFSVQMLGCYHRIPRYFENILVAKGSCKKEHSNHQRKYSSESSESKDVSKSHAECNVAHFSGSNIESHQCTVTKKVIQEKKGLYC